jgi:sugar diacid utilization regulator
VGAVALVEDAHAIERVPADALVLLTRGASAHVGTYRFDVVLRLARSQGAVAVVVSGVDASRISSTAAAVADRSQTAILGARDRVDLAGLAIAIGRELAGDAGVALLRAHAAVHAIAAHPADADEASLVRHAGAALGIPLQLVRTEPAGGAPGARVLVEDRRAWVTAATQEGDLTLALDVVLHAAAAAVAERLARRDQADSLPIQTAAEALGELLVAGPAKRHAIVQRARALGVGIDGWHVAVRVEFEDFSGARMRPEDVAPARGSIALAALRALRPAGATWHSAFTGSAMLLLRMFDDDPGAGAATAVGREVDGLLPRMHDRLGGLQLRCAVGSAHLGPDGLVTSVAEAKAAMNAARTSGRWQGGAVPFDSVGLRRTLVDWYASDVAKDAVSTVLAPLAELDPVRAQRLVHTLQVYLDHQGSLSRTAEVLNLHRNAVSYRVKQVFDLLDVDPDNPDDRLLLQLACRARDLA